MLGRTREVGAVSIMVGVMALSGCLQNAREHAEERALADAAYEYAKARWCLEDLAVAEAGVTSMASIVECFDEDLRGTRYEDTPRLGRGSFLLAASSDSDEVSLRALSAGFASDHSGGGSSSKSAAACWTATMSQGDERELAIAPSECEPDLLERTSGRAPDVGLSKLEGHTPSRPDSRDS